MESMRNLHIVFCFGVVCVAQTMAQVCPYSDPRCMCNSYRVTCNNLQQIPPLNTGVDVSQIFDLSFQDGNITSIPNKSLPPGLTSFVLFRNPLTKIVDDAFDTSATTLQKVYITRAQFNNLPTALKKLTRLIDLHLEDTPIQEWDAATLKQIAATLEYLTLRNVSLFAWPSWISDFHLLSTVDLGKNSLSSIPDDAFSSITDSLTSLDLSFNNLTKVPQALSTLSSLSTLYLSNNNFGDLSEFEGITGTQFAHKLYHLYLESVGLTRIENFSNLTSLTLIDLSGNRISYIPACSLPTSLTTLGLSDNRLATLPNDVAGMSRLSYLDLSSNLIKNIEPNSFPSSLTDLYFSSNNLTIITNTTFINLNVLRYLDLNFNPISTISPEAFSDLVSLQYLLITGSHLTEMPLSFTSLSSQVQIIWTSTHSLTCQCPVPYELIQWFTSIGYSSHIEVSCSNGQSIDSYLSGQCGQVSEIL